MTKLKPLILALAAALLSAPFARAADFSDQLNLAPLRTLAVQHDQTLKTLDTFAREAIYQITGHEKLDGHDPVFTLLDMSFHPENYAHRDIIKISNVPLRQEFNNLPSIDDAEKTRILHQGTVSLAFLEQQDVQDLLRNVQAESVTKSKAIDQVMMAEGAMKEICEFELHLIPAAIVPPALGAGDGLWHRPSEMIGALPDVVAAFQQHGTQLPAAPPGYENDEDLVKNLLTIHANLWDAWDNGDVPRINAALQNLANLMPRFNSAAYPSQARRTAEVLYNRLTMLTIPGAIFYFIAFVLFLMSAQAGIAPLRLWGLRFLLIGFLIHSVGIAIRWWLVGGVFPPIKNEFESVMFSAWFGVVAGLILELRRSRGIFGAAASFVGMLALVAIFAAPYVTGRQIGGEIGQVQGVLMSYWLYIHVTMVTASYSLIGMGFVLSSWWLIRYYSDYGTLRRVPPNLLSSDAVRSPLPPRRTESQDDLPISAGSAVALNFAQTLALTFFFPAARRSAAAAKHSPALSIPAADRSFLATLDLCNLVVLQLAFWMLGAGIILGAVWADQSWGRPWGWDPKETFALVTWMVYLIAVHVRVVTKDKAWWTAVLGFIGFWVMLFNWIGVNFMLVGLHSYA